MPCVMAGNTEAQKLGFVHPGAYHLDAGESLTQIVIVLIGERLALGEYPDKLHGLVQRLLNGLELSHKLHIINQLDSQRAYAAVGEHLSDLVKTCLMFKIVRIYHLT